MQFLAQIEWALSKQNEVWGFYRVPSWQLTKHFDGVTLLLNLSETTMNSQVTSGKVQFCQYENKKPLRLWTIWRCPPSLHVTIFKKKEISITMSLVHNISEKYFKKACAEVWGLGFRDAVKIPFNLKSWF